MWVQKADEGERRSLFLTDKPHKISINGISTHAPLDMHPQRTAKTNYVTARRVHWKINSLPAATIIATLITCLCSLWSYFTYFFFPGIFRAGGGGEEEEEKQVLFQLHAFVHIQTKLDWKFSVYNNFDTECNLISLHILDYYICTRTETSFTLFV